MRLKLQRKNKLLKTDINYYPKSMIMKKNVLLFAAMVFLGTTVFGQAVRDRNVIPVSVNLNQVLRMNVTNGGNIEFVFNTIDEYEQGLSGDYTTTSTGANSTVGAAEEMYQTMFNIASSTSWSLFAGAEQDAMYGTDVPANSIALDNVGLSVTPTGSHDFTDIIGSDLLVDETTIIALPTFQTTNSLLGEGATATTSNAGDIADNAFTIFWRCGTAEGTMNGTPLIDQSVTPDRYTVNVVFDLAAN